MMDIGRQIKFIRESKGIKQTSLAKRLNRTAQWLNNIEKGRRAIRSKDLYDIAQILGVNIDVFLLKN